MYLRGIVKYAIPLRSYGIPFRFQFTEKEEKKINFKPQNKPRRTTQIEWGLQTENFANDYQIA